MNFISNFKFQILFFVASLIVGLVLSQNPMAGVYGLWKLSEMIFLGIYAASMIKQKSLTIIILLFSGGILFESLLAIAQYVNQSSIGGLLYFFGERTFTSQTPGIANAVINGELVLRPYGTFPHPNVLGGYLVVAMTMILMNYELRIKNYGKAIYLIVLSFGTAALFLTMSRIAITLWITAVIIYLFQRFKKQQPQKSLIHYSLFTILLMVFIGGIFIFSPLRFRFGDIGFSSESIIERGRLIEASVAMFKENPVFGMGINNFLHNLPSFQTPNNQSLFSYIQPVHNIYLLILAETGIIGLSFFILFIAKTWRKARNIKMILLSLILILGFFDHYLITLQQGQLLLAFIFGLYWSNISFATASILIKRKNYSQKILSK